MSIRQQLNRWLQKLGLRRSAPPNGDIDLVHKLAHAIQRTKEEEYSCDEAYKLLDEFAEHVHQKEDAAKLMPMVQHHLDMCGNCREEFEALLKIMEIPLTN